MENNALESAKRSVHYTTDYIISMKKILYSDWLRAVQFKCNTCANYIS